MGTEVATSSRSWGGRLEFILTCVGYAVGLGNVWRFPYLTYENGGGAFLIPYVISLVFLGLPIFFMEVCVGQFASLGPTKVWSRMSPIFKGLGFCNILVSAYITIYFGVVCSWIMYYLFASMQETLPWTTCANEWNTPLCTVGAVNDSSNITTAAEEYYYNHVLEMSDGIEYTDGFRWQLIVLLYLNWLIVFLVILNGVASLGKASYVTSLLPYVFMTIMLVRGCTLEGAGEGIRYYLEPEMENLWKPRVWVDAAEQIFFSLGVGMGSLVAMASYNNFKNNATKDSVIVPLINCGTSFYTGFVVFSFLGFMAQEKGVDVADVAEQGPGLIFVVYPEGLAQMPAPPVWSISFFIMMLLIAFSSTFSMAEGVCSSLTDEYPRLFLGGYRPMLLRIAYCVICFLLGLPMVTKAGFYWFNIMSGYGTGYGLLVAGLLESIIVNWIYGHDRFVCDVQMMMGTKPNLYYRICWKYILPIVLTIILGFKISNEAAPTIGDYAYPDWGTFLAYGMATFPLFLIVVFALYLYCYKDGWKLLITKSRTKSNWGPADDINRTGRYAKSAPEIDTVAAHVTNPEHDDFHIKHL